MAELAGQEHLAGNDVARVGIGVDHAAGRDAERRLGQADGVDEFDDARRAEQRVFAHRHRRRAGVAFEAGELQLVPALALAVGDDSDVVALVFEDRPLLDVQFEIGVERPAADRLLALEADAHEFVAELLAVGIEPRIGEFLGVDAGEHARRDHRRRVARAFLVGPVGDLDRVAGLDLEVVERTHDFQRAEHAEHAVELAAGRLGVEMAAEHHGGKIVFDAGAAREHVAHLVDLERTAGLLAPRAEQFASLLVDVSEGEALAAALRRAADLRHFHQRVPQPLSIDADVRQVGHSPLLTDRQSTLL